MIRRASLVVCLLLCSAMAAGTARAEAQTNLLQLSSIALEAGELGHAKEFLDRLPEGEQSSAPVLFQRGMIRFHAGAYGEAVTLIEKAIAAAPKSPHLSDFRRMLAWVTAARDITQDFAESRSADGRYVVRYAKGTDAVLVPYALDAMARADRAIQQHLGITLASPIRLEVYPSAKTLSQVSSLTLEHIETTGTVALCKWNRLMIASPRSLLYGYPWLDTINHELVHLALTHKSQNQAPVWFHEGLAKLFERTWRGLEPQSFLPPSTDALLVSAAHEHRLIPFDRMHPSIAMLPSQEDAALAFAQVVTFLENFRGRHGDTGLANAITGMARGEDARVALSRVAGEPFDNLEGVWKDALATRPEPSKKQTPKELKLRFVERGDADESLDVAEERARKHLRVGDLLWGRNHTLAAAREYERAQNYAPSDPILASRVARASLQADNPARALSAVERALQDHPQHAPLHSLRGTSLVALKRLREALPSLHEAIRLNPFDPAPHCELSRASDDPAEMARERAACAQLGGRAP
jgi:tetratricopeptide (TPR) repeat protein